MMATNQLFSFFLNFTPHTSHERSLKCSKYGYQTPTFVAMWCIDSEGYSFAPVKDIDSKFFCI